VRVVLIAVVSDELDRIVKVIQRELPRVDRLIVPGGPGGTPALAFGSCIVLCHDH
jgi:molybdopterin-biosynthesis enzyme MoeA-like protein